jgi:hypothetical protein
MNLYNSYMTWTQSFQPFQYDLPADTFSGWKFDNSDVYVDDEVQLFGNYDVNEGGVYFSSDEYVLHDNMQKRSASSAYEINGSGSETRRMLRTSDGFCFITGVRAIHGHREDCMIATSNGYWTLTGQSQLSDFQCQASCVQGVGGIVSAHVFLHDRITTPVVRNLRHSTSDSVCFLTHVGRLSSQSQECEVNSYDGRAWSLRARSDHDWFRCAARCVRFPSGSPGSHSAEVVESGTGSWTRSLGTSDTTFCYVSSLRNIHHRDEWCRVGNANRWRLDANSRQGTFRCGGRCIAIAGAAYATVSLDWDFIMENNAGIEVHINEGLQLANSRTLTSSISSAFSVAVEANAIFAGTTVTGTITSEVSEAVGQIVTQSVSRTFVARCPQKSGYYVSLWQYKAVGALVSGGNDVAYTRQYRCQYHESARSVRPECPYSACGNLRTNPLCLRTGCDRWS